MYYKIKFSMNISEPISFRRSGDDRRIPQVCIDSDRVARKIGENWQPQPCNHCTCEESNDDYGHISCQSTMCKSCEKPGIIEPGECCPHCLETDNYTTIAATNSETSTSNTLVPVAVSGCDSLDECELPCYLGAVTDADGCPICSCPDDIPVCFKFL